MKALESNIATLPPVLRRQTRDWLEEFLGRCAEPLSPAVRQALPRVFAMSEFVAHTCLQAPQLLAALDAQGRLQRPDTAAGLRQRLEERLAAVEDQAALERGLRQFRRQEMLRIAWRDLAGWAPLPETLADLTALAECCLEAALERLYRWQCAQWGVPRNRQGQPQQLVVLGMGKLGGGELNFSSDIDLIFAFPDAGSTDGPRGRSNEEFFTALGRQLIAVLDKPTADGFVFRVDIRLRPFGSSGPLAMSFNALETYYQSQGREWERYAMIKARVVAGDRQRGAELLEMLRPFVYRRYLDFGALESLRELKRMIGREVARLGMEDNIKLGRGGIREIEFIAQAFQLIRGGRDPALRQRSLLPVLGVLGERGLLTLEAAQQLAQAYEFLRRTENRLQAMADRQTHDLPANPVDQARLALAMGCRDWPEFLQQLNRWRTLVQEQFDQVFSEPPAHVPEADEREDLRDVWLMELGDDQAAAILRSAGFERAEEVWQRLKALRSSSACRSLSASGRRRLDRLVPLLLTAVARTEQPEVTAARLLQLLEAIARRTAYLALLIENPAARTQLVQLCAASPWVARQLARYPVLLDEMLDARTLYTPLGKAELEAELAQRLNALPEDDLEQQMEALRHFKQAHMLRVAAADITAAVPLMVVSDYLTYLAEAILEAVLQLACAQVAARYPQLGKGRGRDCGMAIVAYGKLGGIELGYGSDLDLVFLHDNEGDAIELQAFYGRITQRVLHILGTPTAGGVLYETDTRLRPSGKSGLLSTTLPAFADYQHNKAWTWEHQALVRARAVAGDPRLIAGFTEIRQDVLRRRRDPDRLREEVREMRERQLSESNRDPALFDLKMDRGGIADIEFMVQYGVLSRAADYPQLVRYTDNIRLLDDLSDTGWISADEARLLADAYRTFRARLHRLSLQELPGCVDAAELVEERAFVSHMWQRLMEA